jgi:ABC-type xylose transport system permease subunit
MKAPTAPPPPPAIDREDERLVVGRGAGGRLATAMSRVRSGDLGTLPIVVGIVLVWALFGLLNPIFLSSTNVGNLLVQSASEGIIALGIVIVLLVGEIDLSVGSMAGVGSSIVGVGFVLHGWPLSATVAVVLAAGAVVGLTYGLVFIHFQVPSFVITLAGLLALLGLQLMLVGQTGSINIPFSSALVRFMEKDVLPHTLSYVLAAAAAAAYAGSTWARARRRARVALSSRSVAGIIVPSALLLVGLEFACWYVNRAGGVSDAFVFFAALVVVMDFMLRRTHWGRAVYAVGGSREAARRAGINVAGTYISVFVLCAMFAALGGMFLAGWLGASSTEAGTGNVNLDAIAAAVIGGTSLFGGRGSAYSALLGIAVIQSIANGLDLLNLSSAQQFMITGGVLTIAVIVDSLSQRARRAHGRA